MFFVVVLLFGFFFSTSYLCMGVLPSYVSVHHVHAWCPYKPEERVRSPKTRIKDVCVAPCVLNNGAIFPAFVVVKSNKAGL